MNDMPRFTWWTLLALLLVLGFAAGARIWYMTIATVGGAKEPALVVQGPPPRCQLLEGKQFFDRTAPTEFDNLAENVVNKKWFGCFAPLADKEESTAHIAPLYPLLLGSNRSSPDKDEDDGEDLFISVDIIVRWLQCLLGTLTAGCYFFFARRAFHSTCIATLAGLLCAFHPFWIVNTAELNDGVLASFFLAVCLALGARAGQVGGAFTGLAFGIALAGVALTRAALLPFAAIALLWFLWQCRRLPLGWFAGFLAILGFVNGLAPWCIRNYFVFERPVPVVTSTYYHLWMGNNPQANGSTMDERTLRSLLSDDRRKELVDANQATRYNQLAAECWQEVQDHPQETLTRRINAALYFLFGESWFKERRLSLVHDEHADSMPGWMRENAEIILQGTLLGMFVLALIGWRLSHAWRRYGRIATIAALCVPLPYVLGHAEYLSGPRLPLDGVLLCYAAFALASFVPGLVRTPEQQQQEAQG
jgi:4-amino-4-deoxy-L-arabinose transferase-like glycosyltransferase